MAYLFDATKNVVLTGAAMAATPTEYTLAAWIKPDTAANRSIIVRSDSSGPGIAWSHSLRYYSASVFSSYAFTGSVVDCLGSTPTSSVSGKWTHVAASALNSGQLRIYVNGIREGAVAIGTLWTGGDRWNICSGSGGGFSAYAGDIAEVAIWYKQLTDAEILRLATRIRFLPLQIQPASLRAYFPMHEVAQGVTSTADWKNLSSFSITQTKTGNQTGAADTLTFPQSIA